MSLLNARQLEFSKKRLAELEALYENAKARPVTDPRGHSLSLRSIAGVIKDLKEEILRFEMRATAGKTEE